MEAARMSARQMIFAWLCLASPVLAQPLTLPLNERPDWLRRDGIVMAGSWEALMMRARIFGGKESFTPTAQQRADYDREHSPETIARLKDMGVNFVMIHCYRGAGMQAERESLADAARFAKRYHDAGLKVGVYNYSGTLFWELFFKEVPESKNWVVLDEEGKPVTYGRQIFRYYWNRNHPDAQAYYRKLVKYAVEDIGADLLHFDNYAVGPGSDANSVERFRQYLRDTFSPQELKKAGVADVSAVGPAMSGRPDNLLRRAWLDFSCQSLADSYWDMTRYARSLRTDILMELNPGGPGSRIHPPIDHGRLLQGGEAFWDEGSSPGCENGQLRSRIRTYKIARCMDNVAFIYTTTPLAMAESMAFNLDCLGCVCWYEFGNIVSRPYSGQPMSPALKPFIRFFNQRRDLLREAQVVADVAVLRSFPSQVFADPKYASLTSRAEQALIENRGCFQIIYDHQLADLGRYRALVLAGCVALSDKQVDQIARYVKSGGRLCLIGPAATHDQWMTPRQTPALEDLPADRVVRVSEDDDCLAAIQKACGGELSLSIKAQYGAPENRPVVPVVRVGEEVYADRPYTITRLPEELQGLPTIRFPVTAVKDNASLPFRANTPVRVFVAFAPRGFSSQWLDPQPDWKLYKKAGLDSTIVDIGQGMDIYYRDFDAGNVVLFEGKQGAYVLLGIKAQSPDFEGAPFTVVQPKGTAALGLCAELTEQSGRRLVHLVNYRSDAAIEDVKVRLRLPAGRRVESVILASPEREGEIDVPFQQEGRSVSFTVPKVGIYEIAAVNMR
jgi:hypothetical protein